MASLTEVFLVGINYYQKVNFVKADNRTENLLVRKEKIYKPVRTNADSTSGS